MKPYPPSRRIPLWCKAWAEKRNLNFEFFPSVKSLNDFAKETAFKTGCPEVSEKLFIAETQTAGRGRNQNRWKNSDLMICRLWEGETKQPLAPFLDEEFALDMLRSAQKTFPALPWKLKKPNDLYLEDKKIAGLLLEVVDQPPKRALILGLGMNVFSHPSVPSAGHIGQWTKSINQNSWNTFLDRLHFHWTERAVKLLKPLAREGAGQALS